MAQFIKSFLLKKITKIIIRVTQETLPLRINNCTMTALQKAIRIFGVLFLIQALLLATHLGEFWPFSIYPMFSRAGNPWTRALARDISAVDENEYWQVRKFATLPGEVFAMDEVGINTNDVSNFIQKVGTWNDEKIATMRNLFDEEASKRELMLYHVRGELVPPNKKEVVLTYTPLLLMTPDTTILNTDFQ